MVFDLVAGAKQRFTLPPSTATLRPARIVVFDSGLGGLTVFPAVRRIAGASALLYAADDAVFPYGGLSEAAVLARVKAVMAALIAAHDPDIVVIACNTVSTLVLPQLRALWPDVAFVGTVPAIKPAAAASRSGLVSVLATPGTVARDYTQTLINTYAAGCAVTLVGARRLATLAERVMRDEPVADGEIRAEITPAFVERDGRRTDTVVLACTHYPLVLPRLEAVAPWPVTWIDPAPAIARRVAHLLDARGLRETIAPPHAGRSGSEEPEPGSLGDPCRGAPVPGSLAAPRNVGSGGASGRDRVLAPVLLTSNAPPAPPLAAFLASCGLRWEASPAFAGLPGRTGLPDGSGLPDKSPAA